MNRPKTMRRRYKLTNGMATTLGDIYFAVDDTHDGVSAGKFNSGTLRGLSNRGLIHLSSDNLVMLSKLGEAECLQEYGYRNKAEGQIVLPPVREECIRTMRARIRSINEYREMLKVQLFKCEHAVVEYVKMIRELDPTAPEQSTITESIVEMRREIVEKAIIESIGKFKSDETGERVAAEVRDFLERSVKDYIDSIVLVRPAGYEERY